MRIAGVAVVLALTACSLPAAPPASLAPPEAMIVDPELAGWNAVALDDALAYAGRQNAGLLILDAGRIIAERDGPAGEPIGAQDAAASDAGAVQDGVLALLAAIAIDRKLLDVDKSVTDYLGPGWSQADAEQERSIRVRHLMEMNSGLDARLDMADPVATTFRYNARAAALLKPILEKAAGQPLEAISRDWLMTPLGLGDAGWTTRPRDLARLGQLVLDKGLAPSGARIVSQRQLEAPFRRSDANPAYGRLWRLNGSRSAILPDGSRRNVQLIPSAPDDLVAVGGREGRLYVVPSRKLVVVRTGAATPDGDFDDQLWGRLMKAAPFR